MTKQPPVPPLVPDQPGELTIDVYRPSARGERASSTPVATVKVTDPRGMRWVIEGLNDLKPRGSRPPLRHPLPTSGAHDILRFSYSDDRLRTIKVTRDRYYTVTVEGLPGEWAPTRPLHASIDLLLPAELREDLGNPTAYPPSEQPEYISEEDALATALGGRQALDDVERPPAYARLMGRRETATLDPGLGAYNYAFHPARKVWVVCVHGEARTRGSLVAPPRTVHGYSLVIDAETGMVTDAGTGSAPLGRDQCPTCRQKL